MLFFELVQVSLGRRDRLSRIPTREEWMSLYEESERQTITGILLGGLDRLPTEQKPHKELLLQWIGVGQMIEQQNQIADKRCVEISRMFSDAGYKSCILKGQGNARMYPKPELRQSGDIDIWVFGNKIKDDKNNTLRKEITTFVKERCPEAFEQYHHIDFPIFSDVPVEVHYTPGQLLSPKYNHRFQQYCRDYSLQPNSFIDYEGYRTPSIEFNAVYQMAHIMIHFFIEGIGLRHFVDYYYVLTNSNLTNTTNVKNTLQRLGMEKFAGGVMWIEQYCLGLEDKYLLVEPSEKAGRLILKEMEEGGNFGHHDERYTFRKKGLIARGIIDTIRLFHLATVFPSESFWKIAKKIENQKWKLMKR